MEICCIYIARTIVKHINYNINIKMGPTYTYFKAIIKHIVAHHFAWCIAVVTIGFSCLISEFPPFFGPIGASFPSVFGYPFGEWGIFSLSSCRVYCLCRISNTQKPAGHFCPVPTFCPIIGFSYLIFMISLFMYGVFLLFFPSGAFLPYNRVFWFDLEKFP